MYDSYFHGPSLVASSTWAGLVLHNLCMPTTPATMESATIGKDVSVPIPAIRCLIVHVIRLIKCTSDTTSEQRLGKMRDRMKLKVTTNAMTLSFKQVNMRQVLEN